MIKQILSHKVIPLVTEKSFVFAFFLIQFEYTEVQYNVVKIHFSFYLMAVIKLERQGLTYTKPVDKCRTVALVAGWLLMIQNHKRITLTYTST